jgi:anti-sigma regulatory factor (Ser/Thr protein kinase)
MERAFDRDYSALAHVFDFVGGALAGDDAAEAAVFSIKLAVEELFTNMVKYNKGSESQITIRIQRRGGALVVALIDEDVDPFDPDEAETAVADGAIEDRPIGGLGLRLVRSVVDRLSYEYKDRKMTVELVKQLEA